MRVAEVGLRADGVRRLPASRAVLATTSDADDSVHQTIHSRGATLTLHDAGGGLGAGAPRAELVVAVDATEHGRVLAPGLEALEPPTTCPRGAHSMALVDPDGDRVWFRTLPARRAAGGQPAGDRPRRDRPGATEPPTPASPRNR